MLSKKYKLLPFGGQLFKSYFENICVLKYYFKEYKL